MKKTMIFVVTAILSVILGVTAFAGTYSEYWKQDASGNWYVQKPDGTKVTDAWLCDDAVAANGKDVWYLLDANGQMISAGLVQDGTGNFYSIETEHNGYYGMLRYKSGNYGGVNLQLEGSHNGNFAAIKNQDGIDALNAKYGLKSVANINNNNCVYTSSFGGRTSSGAGVGSVSAGNASSCGSSAPASQTASVGGKATSVDDAVAAFKAQHITEGMSEFEREMQIIMYLVQNVDYDFDGYMNGRVPDASYEAYGALVNGKAVCQGYAYAFQRLCNACGLLCVPVTGYSAGEGHMWNKVMIDGEWYNVDVSAEDPIFNGGPNKIFGYAGLWNKYINLTDSAMNVDRVPDIPCSECNGTKYGPSAVRDYIIRVTGQDISTRYRTVSLLGSDGKEDKTSAPAKSVSFESVLAFADDCVEAAIAMEA